MRTSDLRGDVALLAFWFPTCPTCRVELPQLEPLYQRYKDDGLKVVAIDVYGDRSGGEKFVADQGLSYQFLNGNLEIARDYGVTATPTMILINREGAIVRSFNRLGPDVEDEIKQLLRE